MGSSVALGTPPDASHDLRSESRCSTPTGHSTFAAAASSISATLRSTRCRSPPPQHRTTAGHRRGSSRHPASTSELPSLRRWPRRCARRCRPERRRTRPRHDRARLGGARLVGGQCGAVTTRLDLWRSAGSWQPLIQVGAAEPPDDLPVPAEITSAFRDTSIRWSHRARPAAPILGTSATAGGAPVVGPVAEGLSLSTVLLFDETPIGRLLGLAPPRADRGRGWATRAVVPPGAAPAGRTITLGGGPHGHVRRLRVAGIDRASPRL